MGAHATHRPWPVDGQAVPDVLVGGDGDGDDTVGVRRPPLLVTGAVVAVVVAAVAVGATAVDLAPGPEAPVLALRAGELVPRDRLVDDRLAEAGMHVEVVNAGGRTLHLRHAALVPGAWEVDIVDRPRLVPGESLVLSLHRTVACDDGEPHGPSPDELVLTARTSGGQDAVVRLPVADPAAYGGLLDDALRDPGRACVVSGDEVAGPLGDLVSSWRARRAWPPQPSG